MTTVSRQSERPGASLRARLIFLALALAIPAAGFQGYAAWRAYTDALDRGNQRALQAAHEAAVAVVTFLDLAERQTQGVANLGADVLLDPSRCDLPISLTRDLLPFYAGISVVDAEGTVVCTALEVPPGGQPTARDRAWFNSLMATGNFTISEPLVGRITQENLIVLAAPVRDGSGAVVGGVSGGMGLDELSSAISRGIRDDVTVVTIADSLGVVIARTADAEAWHARRLPASDDPALLFGEEGIVFRTVGLDGTDRTVGRVDVEQTGWRVYASIPDEVLFGPEFGLVRVETLASLALLILALALAIWVYRGISSSLSDLTHGVASASAGIPATVPQGSPKEFAAVVEQLNRTLEERANAEERHRVFLQGAPFGAYVSTMDGTILEANDALAQMTGYSRPAELLKVNLAELYSRAEDRDELMSLYEAPSTFEGLEVRWQRRDGSPLLVRLTGRRRGDRDEGIFEVIVEDITAQRELEIISRHQQKVEVVGRLASGVAHDLNNVLTIISGNSDLLLEGLGPDQELRQEAQEISLAVTSAAALTRNLLAFSRRRVLKPQAFRIQEVVETLVPLIERTLPATISLDVRMPDHVHPVWMDKGNLEQCILNLVVNARDAMPEGGTLVIDAEERPGSDGVRGWTVVSVTDNGAGMDKALQEQAVEPFFTTKAEGHGTGLGLSTVQNIVEDVDGTLRIESRAGEGTRVEMWLPQHDDGPSTTL